MAKITLETFIKRHGITMTVKHAGKSTETTGQFRDTKDNWRCTLQRGDDKLVTPFSMGSGHNGKEPTLPEVLDCMASDSATLENASSFEEWASELGYDSDSRKAEKIHRACQEQRTKLRAFLGDLYDTLLWKIER